MSLIYRFIITSLNDFPPFGRNLVNIMQYYNTELYILLQQIFFDLHISSRGGCEIKRGGGGGGGLSKSFVT